MNNQRTPVNPTITRSPNTTTVKSSLERPLACLHLRLLREDLSYIGTYGTRGLGYEVEILIDQIERVLGLTREQSCWVLRHSRQAAGTAPAGNVSVELVDGRRWWCRDRECGVGRSHS